MPLHRRPPRLGQAPVHQGMQVRLADGSVGLGSADGRVQVGPADRRAQDGCAGGQGHSADGRVRPGAAARRLVRGQRAAHLTRRSSGRSAPAMCARSASRARLSRDITVPTGTSSTAAASR